MSTGLKFNTVAGVIVLCLASLCMVNLSATDAVSTQTHKKAKKKPELPPLPSGPTGRPVQPIPLDSIAPVAPQVSYQNAQLSIVAPNSTLADILRAVRKQTGAEIEIPVAPERVVTNLGPGPARAVLAELLNGSRFNYVLLGSAANDAVLTRVVLVAKTAPDNSNPAEQPQPGIAQAVNMQPQPPNTPDSTDGDINDNSSTPDEAEEQPAAAEAEQPVSPDQPAVKTPQQLLQEMQQRQLQMQQQQPGAQSGAPGAVVVPHPQEQ